MEGIHAVGSRVSMQQHEKIEVIACSISCDALIYNYTSDYEMIFALNISTKFLQQ